MKVRACFSFSSNTDGRFLRWVPHGPGGHFTGLAAFFQNIHIEVLTKITENITVVEANKFGYRINATSFDGCLGRLQANTSDVFTLPQDLTLYAPGIEIGKTHLSKSYGLVSAYDTHITGKKQELMHTVQGIPVEIWITVLLLTLLTSLAFTLGKVLLNVRRVKVDRQIVSQTAYKSTVSLFQLLLKLVIKQSGDDRIGSNGFTFKFMVFIVILLAFYFNFFATVFIKTNAVTLDRPKTIESFDDIINSDLRPMFRVAREEHIPFRNAAVGTKKRQIWNKAVRMGIEKSLTKNTNYSEMLEGKSVVILTENPQPTLMSFFCQMFRRQKPRNCPIVRLETGETDTLKMIMKSSFMDRQLSRAIDKMYQRIFEAGYLSIEQMLVRKVFGITSRDDGCMSNRVVMPDPGFNSIGFLQIRMLVVSSVIALAVAFLMLIYEQIGKFLSSSSSLYAF